MAHKAAAGLLFSCSICEFGTNNTEKLESHVRKHFKEEPFSCFYCESKYKTTQKLTDHMLDNHHLIDEFRYTCRYCNIIFNNVNNLILHEIQHQPENSECQVTEPFDCLNCGSTFKTNALAIYHKNFDCGDRAINCSACQKKFTLIKDFNLHARIHKNLRSYQCKFCCKYFKQGKEFLHHMQKMHRYELQKQEILLINNKNAKNNFQLMKNLKFDEDALEKDVRDSTLSETILKKHGLKRTHICPVCSLSFVQETTLQIHCRRDHPDTVTIKKETSISEESCSTSNFYIILMNIKQEPEITDKCSICNEEFSSHAAFATHLLDTHNGRKPYKCTICLMSFTRSITLFQHCYSHRTAWIACKYCHMIMRKENLKDHLKLHEGIYIIKCPICFMPFTNGKLLINHGRIHSKDVTPKCNLCKREFMDKNELKNHIKLHENLSIFKCSICGTTNKTQNSLIEHIKEHNSKQYSKICSICKKGFSSKTDLICHMLSHSNKAEYNCQVCDEEFPHKNSLRHHLLISIRCCLYYPKIEPVCITPRSTINK